MMIVSFLMSHGTRTASVSCNEKKSSEMLPFMCDEDDESWSLLVEAHTEKTEELRGDQTFHIM